MATSQEADFMSQSTGSAELVVFMVGVIGCTEMGTWLGLLARRGISIRRCITSGLDSSG
jgi:hypothetical protein